jgi:hypothetical protein
MSHTDSSDAAPACPSRPPYVAPATRADRQGHNLLNQEAALFERRARQRLVIIGLQKILRADIVQCGADLKGFDQRAHPGEPWVQIIALAIAPPIEHDALLVETNA